ncbi:MAG TPA: carbon-nitrogen hydrolase family protein [Alphaproteobacteria bacterium]|nr:carbon-nitrogen hydrolase family protein [Alphaproteobacteria bacterium]
MTTGRREVTIAAVQMDVKIGDVPGTLAKIETWIDEASGADIVMVPELVLSAGYSLGDKFYDIAESIPGPATEALGRKAKQHKLYVVAGLAERDAAGTVYNSAVIIGRDGSVVGAYRKTHIFPATESFFALGNTLPVFDLDFGRIAIPICYDLEFPEPARVLCLEGAELLLSMAAHWIGTGSVGAPANFITTIYAARALENRVPVVLANRVGYDPGLNDNFIGLSRIVDSDGMTVAAMADDREGMITATLDLNEERRKRQSYNYFRDRKPGLYNALVAPR